MTSAYKVRLIKHHLIRYHSHVVNGTLHYERHHGKAKLSDFDEFDTINLVLTTYHTVAAEWKAIQAGRKSTLFSVHWHRIILDEGITRRKCALNLNLTKNQLILFEMETPGWLPLSALLSLDHDGL